MWAVLDFLTALPEQHRGADFLPRAKAELALAEGEGMNLMLARSHRDSLAQWEKDSSYSITPRDVWAAVAAWRHDAGKRWDSPQDMLPVGELADRAETWVKEGVKDAAGELDKAIPWWVAPLAGVVLVAYVWRAFK